MKLVEQTAGEYGVILRTNAAEASDETVLLELEVLSERYETMAGAAAQELLHACIQGGSGMAAPYQRPAEGRSGRDCDR